MGKTKGCGSAGGRERLRKGCQPHRPTGLSVGATPCVFRSIVTDRFGKVTGQFGIVTEAVQ